MELIDKIADISEIGGKAHALLSLDMPNTPPLLLQSTFSSTP